MTPTRQTELMHAVLDRAASPAEERELSLWLAANPSAQAEFEALQGLFQYLARVPELEPPAGMAGEIVKKYASEGAAYRSAHKLFSWLRVSGISLPTNFWGDLQMSQQAPSRKRTVWIGLAVAGIAVVAVGHFVFDIPPSQQLAGTITPAQRYRAEQQLTTQDVKLADQGVAQALQNDAVVKLIKDPNFQAIAKNSAAAASFASNVQAFAALAQQPAAFAAVAANSAAFAALASNAQVFAAVAANPEAFAQYASNSNAFASAAANAASVPAMQANAASFQALASNSQAMSAIAAGPSIFAQMAANAASFQALASNSQAMAALGNPNAVAAMGANSQAFSQLAAAPQALAALSANSQALAAIQAAPSAFASAAANLSAAGSAASSAANAANMSAAGSANSSAAGSAASQQQ